MSTLDQVMGGKPAPSFVIKGDAIESIFDGLLQAAIDKHNCRQACQYIDQFVFFQARATNDQPIDPFFLQRLDHRQLALWIFLGVTQENVISLRVSQTLYSLGNLRKKG